MRKYAAILLILCAVIPQKISAAAPAPNVRAQAAIIMDYASGRVLWEKNAHAPMAMASTTKIMTAIVTLENADLSDTVTVSARAAGQPQVKMFLNPGEEAPLAGLLQALMLQSSNDAAVAIAEHVGGTVEAFCAMMTEKAKEIGAEDTLFVTPNGLDAGDHHSTAYDLALITRYALGNEAFVRLINTPAAEVATSRRTYHITNHNRLLNEYDGANGVKTGFTGKAGQCFVGAAKRGDLQLITVALASGWGAAGRERKWVDAKNMLNYAFSAYRVTPIVTEGLAAGAVVVSRSRADSVETVYGASVALPLAADERFRVSPRLPETIKAPVSRGDVVGTAVIELNGEAYGEIPLLADADVARHDMKTSLETVIEAFLTMGTDKPVEVTLPEF